MRLGITLEDENGIHSNVSMHFGQCKYFFIADIKDNKIEHTRIIPNIAQHGGGGCRAVDEILQYNITHLIAGGMGMNAQNKFAQAGVQVFGYSGTAMDAIEDFLKNSLGGLESCKEHSNCK